MAFAEGSKPEIFHSDQGSQFTSIDFVELLQAGEDHDQLVWQEKVFCQHSCRVTVADRQVCGGVSVGLQPWFEG
jgi:hypothetical protein